LLTARSCFAVMKFMKTEVVRQQLSVDGVLDPLSNRELRFADWGPSDWWFQASDWGPSESEVESHLYDPSSPYYGAIFPSILGSSAPTYSCPSVCLSVCPSVRLSVRPSVRGSLVFDHLSAQHSMVIGVQKVLHFRDP